ncbi:hypothetical protein PsAD2_00767 [Pseudovibrio axinellae]|uniref:DUF2029 domain-containing protein n=1 Tax=Pseudovibrio axinellae TaxID=989403 RepID=A0A166ARR2_9HYPH|nr:glycosyltransferase family 87 protein [Pseudovibrio axinellae]KZL21472.1 hypothetical protein PsAD2_00767 [Pseudovibrio axinellae]SER06449.1 Protein of unknown function [Pseudovibrio axinellae]
MFVSFARLQIYFIVALLLVAVVYPIYLFGSVMGLDGFDLRRVGGDFYQFLLASRMAVSGQAAQLYDFGWFYGEVQRNVVAGSGFYAWVHPPSLLVFLVPLSGLTYLQAYGLWMGSAAALSIFVSFSRKAPIRAFTFFIFAPATLVNLFYGQSGMLAGGLLYGGLRLMDRHPAWAGVLLGFVSIKPELFMLIPIILIAYRSIIALCACVVTVAFLVDASAVFFGSGLWWIYLETVPSLLTTVMDQGEGNFLYLIPSAFGAARALGFSATAGYMVQLPFTILAFVVTFWLFMREREPVARNLAVTLCVLLATPFLFLWDYAVLSPALYLYATRTGLFDEDVDSPYMESILLFAVYLLPIINIALAAHGFPVGPVFTALALIVVIARMAGAGGLQTSVDEKTEQGDKSVSDERESDEGLGTT